MSTKVDLSGLAYERKTPSRQPASLYRVLTRYVAPSLVIAALLTVLALAAWDTLAPKTPVTVIPVHVSQAVVQREGTPLFKAAGWIEPRPTHIAVPALASGVVGELLVVEDQAVEAGEPVALLVDDDARLKLSATRAAVRLAEARRSEVEARLTAANVRFEQPAHLKAPLAEARAKLATVQAQLADLPYDRRTAEARLEFARANYEGKTRAGVAISQRTIEQSKSELEVARSRVDQIAQQEISLKATIEALTAQTAALEKQLELKSEEQRERQQCQAQLVAATAQLEQATVAYNEAQLELDRMTVRAPAPGRVWRLWASPGSRLFPGMAQDHSRDGSTVVTMYQPGKLQVRVDVRFDDLPQVMPGQPALIEIPAVGQPLSGEVLFASSLADIQKNTLEVKVAIIDPPEVLKPEMLVDVTFLAPEPPEPAMAAERQQHLFVPKRLVRQGETGPFVWVADQTAGVARRTPIETGSRGGSEMIEVTRGLTITSRLIVTPAEGLEDGEAICVTGEED